MDTTAHGAPLPTVVYIAGYGRSGSTLLDMILACHDDAVGTGELSFVFSEVLCGQPCTCGEALVECPLWGPVLERVRKNGFTWEEAVDITHRGERLLSTLRDPVAYGRLWGHLITAVRDESGASIVIDSSKSARWTVRRARMLSEHTLNTVRTIHLVRHPVGVMESVHHGYNGALEAGVVGNSRLAVARSLLGWIVANSLIEYARRRSQQQTLLLRYEDLVADPSASVRKVGAFIGCDLSAVASHAATGEIPAGHGIAGNRMRRTGAVRLQAPVAAEHPPTPAYIRMLALLTWPLLRRYGYGRTGA